VRGTLPDVVVAASRLRAALEDTAAALAGADLDRLLASEALLQQVLNDIPRLGSDTGQSRARAGSEAGLTPDDRARLRAEIDEAQSTLRRCRRLGTTLSDFVRLSLDAQSLGLGYDPARAATEALTGRTFTGRA
jgi:hypothetical protein